MLIVINTPRSVTFSCVHIYITSTGYALLHGRRELHLRLIISLPCQKNTDRRELGTDFLVNITVAERRFWVAVFLIHLK